MINEADQLLPGEHSTDVQGQEPDLLHDFGSTYSHEESAKQADDGTDVMGLLDNIDGQPAECTGADLADLLLGGSLLNTG